MPEVLRFRCPHCQARIKAPYQLLGRQRPCPACGRLLQVQLEAPEDIGPVLLADEKLQLVWRYRARAS
jgi:endogenous inhibitor of DNA gyrase (YacG/DUF329 family)